MPAAYRIVVWTVFLSSICPAAELGDINGDGRVSYADAWQWARYIHGGAERYSPAPGSADWAGVFDCSAFTGGGYGFRIPLLLEMEALRRVSASPLPHFLERWPEPVPPQAPPPPPDDRVMLELLPVNHEGPDSRLTIRVRLTNSIPLAGLHLVLQPRGFDLRPPLSRTGSEAFDTSAEYTLISNGLLVYHTPLPPEGTVLAAGSRVLEFESLLRRGTTAGEYQIELAAGTEAIDADSDSVLIPVLSSGSLQVVSEVMNGPLQALPPLRFDENARAVLGRTEIRLTEAEGLIGDKIIVRAQMRTERPVNAIGFRVKFDGWALRCIGATPLLPDPEEGIVKTEDFPQIWCGNATPFLGEHYGSADFDYTIVPRHYSVYDHAAFFGSQPPSLTYIPPSEAWTDLVEFCFTVREGASGQGSTPLAIVPYHEHSPTFVPYSDGRFGGMFDDSDLCDLWNSWWTEETVFHPGQITVRGGTDRVEPRLPMEIQEAGIVHTLVDAEGRPGDEVRVDVLAKSEVDVFQFNLVERYDATRLELLGFEVFYVNGEGNTGFEFLNPSDWSYHESAYRSCADERDCLYGFPASAALYGSWRSDVLPEGTAIVTINKAPTNASYLDIQRYWAAREVHDLGRFIFRVRDDAPNGLATVEGAEVEFQNRDFAVPLRWQSGGKPLFVAEDFRNERFERYDVPAVAVNTASIRIRDGREVSFLRGDSNGDGLVDLSDAVATLGYLFLGDTVPGCLDSADADDSGGLELTDAIFLLSALFLGTHSIPEPFPSCGVDPTSADALECQIECK